MKLNKKKCGLLQINLKPKKSYTPKILLEIEYTEEYTYLGIPIQ